MNINIGEKKETKMRASFTRPVQEVLKPEWYEILVKELGNRFEIKGKAYLEIEVTRKPL